MYGMGGTEGKTALGLSSPAKPALQLVYPTSITMAETSSSQRKKQKFRR